MGWAGAIWPLPLNKHQKTSRSLDVFGVILACNSKNQEYTIKKALEVLKLKTASMFIHVWAVLAGFSN